jgi:tetratricopeptide (TPR) repeat protein
MGERDFPEAERRFEKSLELFRQADDQLGVSIVRNNQGVLSRRAPAEGHDERAKRLVQAREFLMESLTIRRGLQDLMGEAETLNNLGVVAFECEDFEGAWNHYRDALHIERELRRTLGIGTALANLGEVAGVLGDRELAIRFMAVSERVLEDIKSPLAGAVHSMLLDLAEEMPSDELQDLVVRARTLPAEASIDQVLSSPLKDPTPALGLNR